MQSLLPQNNTSRKILHLDMDAFYASVEMRDNPSLKNKALVVAHDPRTTNGHGVITTANYIARQYGVGSAMPAIRAVEQVPKELLVFVAPNFKKYKAVSAQIHEYMHEITDQIESVSLDEAYLDITSNKLGKYSGIELGNYLQEKIFQNTKLTSSFGVSYNKFLAKMGSEYAKPFGRSLIRPDEALAFLARQPIKKFPGIGKKTQIVMHEMGIETGKDLQKHSVSFLIEHFKKFGYYLAMHANGIDLRPVKWHRVPKSIGKERTFEPAMMDYNRALTQLREFSDQVAAILQNKKMNAQIVTLKIRNPKYETQTKRQMLANPTQDTMKIFEVAKEIFNSLPQYTMSGIRLLGVSVSDLKPSSYQELTLPLFDTNW